MIIYSELTKANYKTVKECEDAEKAYTLKLQKQEEEKKRLSAKRKSQSDEVQKAYDELKAAQANFNQKLAEFCKNYGSWHYSLNNGDGELFSSFFAKYC